MVPPIGFVVCIIIGIAALGGTWFLKWSDYDEFSKKWFYINRTIYDVIFAILFLLVITGLMLLIIVLICNFLLLLLFLWVYFREHTFLLKMFVTFLVFLIGYFILNKKLPAEKYLKAYKKGKISKETAIMQISEIIYNPNIEKIPNVMQSMLMKYRINAFAKRLKAERDLLPKIKEYLKIKELSKK